MPKKNKNPENPSGVILYAKRSGITSFSSLWSIKKALFTDKVGHTGTLDSFAEGLLVVLTGSLTHLVSHVTSFKKTYRAVVCFGTETDTLDPTGNVCAQGRALSESEVASLCDKFRGALLQVPPVFSALHVGGQRASDAARKGEHVELEPRQVFIYGNKLLAYKAATANDANSYALIEVTCSKGTYIRALARDMAKALGTVAHLSALRRTQVGPFSLDDAACYSLLEDFTIENALKKDFSLQQKDTDSDVFKDIRNHFLSFTPSLSFRCGLQAEILNAEHEKSYMNGRPLAQSMFSPVGNVSDSIMQDFDDNKSPAERSVFYKNGQFAGVISIGRNRPEYSFVVPKKDSRIKTFSWQQIVDGDFPAEWAEKGVALSVGGFDAIHVGHAALIDAVLSRKELVPGLVMFRSSIKEKNGKLLPDVLTLRQRLDILSAKGLSFVVIVDFSHDFAKMTGAEFLSHLLKTCHVRYLAEGADFRCGWKGAFSRDEIADFASEQGFSFDVVSDVFVGGERVSTTRVRDAIEAGNFELVQELLGRPFALQDKAPLS